jgi:hypothetical protein
MMPNIMAPVPVPPPVVMMAHDHSRRCDERRRDVDWWGRRRRRRWWRRTTRQDTEAEKTEQRQTFHEYLPIRNLAFRIVRYISV